MTSNDGQRLTVDEPTVILQGKGWVDIRQIRLAGTDQQLDTFWPESDVWQTELPLRSGLNTFTLEAVDFRGNIIGSQTVEVESTASSVSSDALRVTEIHFNPASPTAAEIVAGLTDSDDFEFLEIYNSHPSGTLDLNGFEFVEGVEFAFTDVQLKPLEYAVMSRILTRSEFAMAIKFAFCWKAAVRL